jgi:hypothetical protein
MSDDSRVKRLRDLVAQLEQLPATPERDRLLADVRARAVDVDLGEDPQPRRIPDPIPALVLDEPAQARAPRPAPTPPPFVPARKPPPAPLTPPRAAPEDEAELGWTTDVLWGDDSPEPGSDEEPPRPWTLGLRG